MNSHFIYICIYVKYDNQTLPVIPQLIISYLLENPDKLNHYLNNKIHIGQVLDYLSNKSINSNKEILELIIKFIEV